MKDPRPRTAKKPDGSPDQELEKRFEVIFKSIGPLTSPRPTDLPSLLAVVQELYDRMKQ